MTTKKVAVLLATYNGEKYLSEFLESLSAQSFKGFELFVRDDGSSDRTLNILADYSSRLSIIILEHTERLGAAKSFIQLLVESGGYFDCYMFADQDDYWHLEKIERAQAKLSEKKNEMPTLYCAGLELVDSSLSHISFPSPPRVISFNNALVENVATGCTIALNGKARRLVIDNLPRLLTMHDWWLYVIFSAIGKVVYDDFTALKYRQHDGNAVGAATNAYQDLVRRSKRFFSKKKGGVFGIADQAEEFYRCYSHHLNPQDAELVQSLVSGKKSLTGRLSLAFLSNFMRQKPLDTLILRVMFILGRF